MHIKDADGPMLHVLGIMAHRLTLSARRLLLALVLGALLMPLGPAWPAAADSVSLDSPALSQQIGQRLQSAMPLTVEGLVLDRAMLAQVYGQRTDAPIWAGHGDWAASLETALAEAGRQAITPQSLGLSALQQALADPALPAADRDLVLTDRFLAYAAILARGRVDIGAIENDWTLPTPVFDPAATIAALEASRGPAGVLQKLAPTSPGYERLLAAYARYNQIAASGGWKALPAGTRLRLGDAGPLVESLGDRLAAEGDLSGDWEESQVFDARLAAAVSHFQQRHGLLVDGRVGPATLAALNVGAEDRASQLALNLERLRAMPRTWPATRIEVEQSSQMLTYYRDGKPALVSRVIVGQAIHPTPVLAATVQRVVLDPAWVVPVSIIRNEIQPRLRVDPGYLARNHFEILGRKGGDPTGRDLNWKAVSILAMGWELRQLPGPWNALGSVMLDMPNPFDVYLHDTPFHSLFALPQRALSHGCVRVDLARDLAGALLGAPLPAPGGPTRIVPLAAPVPVYFLYQTAFVDENGTVEFRDDIYGRDARLLAAMAAEEHGAQAPSAATVSLMKSCPGIAADLAQLN